MIGNALLRFMEREHLQNFDVSWGHEPLERDCVEDQPQQSRSGNVLRLVEDDTAALRFMERSLRTRALDGDRDHLCGGEEVVFGKKVKAALASVVAKTLSRG